MDKCCFSCGDPTHFYSDCPSSNLDVKKNKKMAKIAYRDKYSQVNVKTYSRYQERMTLFEEGLLIPVGLIRSEVERKIDQLRILQEKWEDRGEIVLNGAGEVEVKVYLKGLNCELDDILAGIRMISAYTKAHTTHNPSKINQTDLDILFYKQLDLRKLRDYLVKEIKVALNKIDLAERFGKSFLEKRALLSTWLQETEEIMSSGRPERRIIANRFSNFNAYKEMLKELENNVDRLSKIFDPPSINLLVEQMNSIKANFYDLHNNCESYILSEDIEQKLKLEKELESAKEKIQCKICLEREVYWILGCGHAYCNYCLTEIQTRNQTCPTCRKPILQKTKWFKN